MGFVVNLIFHNIKHGWRYMLVVGVLSPMVVFALAICVMAETPRWLRARA